MRLCKYSSEKNGETFQPTQDQHQGDGGEGEGAEKYSEAL